MNDSDKVKIYIHIAGQRIPLSIDPDRQGAVRRAEREVTDLLSSWRSRFPAKTDMEILAMAAYQFASYYTDLRERVEAARDLALQIDDRLAKAVADDATEPQT